MGSRSHPFFFFLVDLSRDSANVSDGRSEPAGASGRNAAGIRDASFVNGSQRALIRRIGGK